MRERLTPAVMAVVYPPGADRLGPEEGSPPAIAVYQADKVVAYVFSTLDIIAAPGYSTTPFDVIAGVDLGGHITGAKVVFHNEPYIAHDPQRQRLLDTFLAREAGRPLRGGANLLPPDFVSGATVSTRAMRAAVSITASLVLRARIARAPAAVPALDVESFSRKSWETLVAAGAVVQRRVTAGEVAAALAEAGASGAKLDVPLGKGDDLYIDFSTALFTPAAIGGNLVGMVNFEEYKRRMPADAQAIFIASHGPYDFLGKKFFLDSEGNRFDRLRVVQDGHAFTFVQADYQFLNPFAEGIRGQQDAGLFALPVNAGFDPLKPWRLELLVNTVGADPVTVAFGLDYKVPDLQALTSHDDARPEVRTPSADPSAGKEGDLVLPLEADIAPVPAWIEAWHDSRVNVAILAVLLSVLTLIFVFQATLARFRLAHRLVRNGFLLIVLVWLGWTAGVQLSIVNVMNYAMAPFNHFDIGFYLAEPLMVIVAAYTLLSVMLIGRGVFCGWLCPFGALQELLGQLSRALRVPQWNPPAALERRLWWGKYIAAATVLVLVLTQIDPSGAIAGDRAVQDGDHLEVHPRLALPALCGRLARDRTVLRARLLPLSVPAGRRARLPRPAAPHRSSQAAARMRQSLPSVRAVMSGPGDREDRQDRHRGMLSVPRLPSRILRRQALPAAGAGCATPRRGQAGDRPRPGLRAHDPRSHSEGRLFQTSISDLDFRPRFQTSISDLVLRAVRSTASRRTAPSDIACGRPSRRVLRTLLRTRSVGLCL